MGSRRNNLESPVLYSVCVQCEFKVKQMPRSSQQIKMKLKGRKVIHISQRICTIFAVWLLSFSCHQLLYWQSIVNFKALDWGISTSTAAKDKGYLSKSTLGHFVEKKAACRVNDLTDASRLKLISIKKLQNLKWAFGTAFIWTRKGHTYRANNPHENI